MPIVVSRGRTQRIYSQNAIYTYLKGDLGFTKVLWGDIPPLPINAGITHIASHHHGHNDAKSGSCKNNTMNISAIRKSSSEQILQAINTVGNKRIREGFAANNKVSLPFVG